MKNVFALLLLGFFAFVGISCLQAQSPRTEPLMKESIFSPNYTTMTAQAAFDIHYLAHVRYMNQESVDNIVKSIPDTFESSSYASIEKPVSLPSGLVAYRSRYAGNQTINVRILPTYYPSILHVQATSAGYRPAVPFATQNK